MNKTIIIIMLGAFATGINSCKKGCTDPSATNYDEKARKEDNSCVYPDELVVPSSYSFKDSDGNSTVNFTGQQIRLDMLSEMIDYMKTGNTSGTTLNATTMKDMFANNGYTWVDANGLGMTGSTKQLKDKTAFSTADGSPDAGIQLYLEDILDSAAVASASGATGGPGVTGVWPNDGTAGPYLMDGNGRQYNEMFEKGVMSAVFANQMTVNYLGTVQDDDNSTLVSGENYTEMQHHWDEAYGYFTYSVNFPTVNGDRFWEEYSTGREALLGSATNISLAFRTGRAAIDAEDYTTRDEQIDIIRDEMEKLQAASAIHYLNGAKAAISSNNSRNHKLSEAVGFLHGMKFGYNCISGNGMSSTEIDQALGYIGDDFNNVSVTYINLAIDLIADKTGLTSIKNDL